MPKAFNRAYSLHNGKLTVYCIGCKWESDVLRASSVAYLQDNVYLRGLTSFERGYLAGAFRNHECKE